MERERVFNEVAEAAGNLKAVLSLLYAVNVEAVSQETFERVCLMAIGQIEGLEQGIEGLK